MKLLANETEQTKVLWKYMIVVKTDSFLFYKKSDCENDHCEGPTVTEFVLIHTLKFRLFF
jgi:hypothetical protein